MSAEGVRPVADDPSALCDVDAFAHNHGRSTCRLPQGHDGKHEGRCEPCWWDDGDWVVLTW